MVNSWWRLRQPMIAAQAIRCTLYSFCAGLWDKIQKFAGMVCFSVNMEPSPNMVICESKEETLWPWSVWHPCSIVNWMLASILSSDADVKGLLQFSSNICQETFATNKEQLAIYWPWQDPGPPIYQIYWPIPTESLIKKILPLYVKEYSRFFVQI